MTRAILLGVVLACGGFGTCSGTLNDDHGFNLWCGEELCAWELEAGAIERIATWHERDSAAELVGPFVVLSQRFDLAGETCIGLEILADVDAGVAVGFEADFDDDGSIDWADTMPATGDDWFGLQKTIPVPYPSSSVRLRVTKTNDGHAAIAQLIAWDSCY
jgi:hypothetical protein